jgi:hypothetical protein
MSGYQPDWTGLIVLVLMFGLAGVVLAWTGATRPSARRWRVVAILLVAVGLTVVVRSILRQLGM